MAHGVYLTLIDQLLRRIRQSDAPFGGVIVVAGGDFRQTAPIVPGGHRRQIVAASVKATELWAAFEQFQLTVAVRQQGDPQFSAFLGDVGDGTSPSVSMVTGQPLAATSRPARPVNHGATRGADGASSIRIPSALVTFDDSCELPPPLADVDGPSQSTVVAPEGGIRVFTTVERAAEWVHDGDHLRAGAQACARRAMIAPHNHTVNEHNAAYLATLPGDPVTLFAAERAERDDSDNAVSLMSREFMASVNEPGQPEHTLVLKPGALVLVTRNLFLTTRLLNGSRVAVETVNRRVVVVRTINQPDPGAPSTAPCTLGERVFIPRVTATINVPGAAGLAVRRTQYPLRLAYSITINRSQGKTLSRACVDARAECFGHGQLYVAAGRVCARTDLALLLPPDRIVRDPTDNSLAVILRNVVYDELLRPDGIDVAAAPVPQWPSDAALAELPPQQDTAWDADHGPIAVTSEPADIALDAAGIDGDDDSDGDVEV
jgi:ATP-dependent DNA helicase PIF1